MANSLSGGWGGYGSGTLMGYPTLTGRPYSNGFTSFNSYRQFSGYGNGRSSLARSYAEYVAGNWALGMPPTNDPGLIGSRGAAPPQSADALPVDVGLWPQTQPASGEDAGGNRSLERVSLATLVSTQLAAKRKARLDSGWAAFRQGDYQRACDEFALADGYGSIEKREQIETRVPLIFARVAARQFAEAVGALEWVLRQYETADAETQRHLFETIPNLPECYGRRYALDEHLRDLGDYVAMRDSGYRTTSNTEGATEDAARLGHLLMQARALQIFVLYAVPDQRPRVLSEVRGFSTMPSPWKQLSNLLENRNLGQSSASAIGQPLREDRPAADFPFNMLEERAIRDGTPHAAPRP